jgi:hypothetical protein
MVRGNPQTAARPRALPVAFLSMLLAIGCGSPASPEHTAAVADLQQLGAKVNIKRGGYEVDLSNTGITDKDLLPLQKISNLKVIDLRGTLITDAGLEHLKVITTLEVAELGRTNITDEGFENLKKSLPNASLRH